jgi:hypothetical protein
MEPGTLRKLGKAGRSDLGLSRMTTQTRREFLPRSGQGFLSLNAKRWPRAAISEVSGVTSLAVST